MDISTFVLVNDQREHPSSSPPVLVNDQREHPSSSPPLMFLRPGNSTCVTDIGRSVRVSRKLGRVGRSVRVSRKLNSTCVTDMDSIFGVRICRHRKYKAIPYLNDTYRTPPQHVMHTHMADPLTSQCS